MQLAGNDPALPEMPAAPAAAGSACEQHVYLSPDRAHLLISYRCEVANRNSLRELQQVSGCKVPNCRLPTGNANYITLEEQLQMTSEVAKRLKKATNPPQTTRVHLTRDEALGRH